MEFDTTAQFEAVIDPSSLSSARDDIESELGDVEVQVAAQVDGGSGGAGSRSMVDEFETEHKLSERRNELLEDLLDAQEQDTYNRAARLGGGAGGAALAGMLGVGAMGLSALSQFEWPELPPLKPTDISPVPVDAPSSIPIDAPDSIPVDAPEAIPVDVPEFDPLELEKPDWIPIPIAGPSSSPSGDGTGDGTGTGAPAPTPDIDEIQQPGPGPAAAPAPTGNPNPQPQPTGDGDLLPGLTVNPEKVAGGVAAGAAAGGLAKLLSGGGQTAGGTASFFAGLPANLAARSARRSQERPRDQQTWFDRLVGDALEGTDLGGTSTTAGAASATGATQLLAQSGQQGSDPGRERSPSTTIEHSPTYNLEGLRDLERKMKRDKREIEQKIENLENSFSSRR